MLEKVKEIVAEGLDVNAADLTEETTFESLGADSLDLKMNLVWKSIRKQSVISRQSEVL